ncbi:MFS transporter [Arthrobacter sp. zg-Y1219]|uniref:MFS transporter n=1 Tax=Arthrobacter sp. zg-Y1219 TaxID=3049067 RepID=UPI0024C32CBF|nr:MFS transporter [Arthrobacter sp. zg-Y1219]MDK1361024.1 MFS transporter [Arthrobacter sp. zg-Y1219]
MNLGSEYRRIWIGNASSNLADGVTFVALPLLAVEITNNPLVIAALSIFYTAPRLLSVLGIGVLVDRFDRRRLLYLANFSRAAIFAALTALVLADATPMAALYAVYAFMGIVETISDSSAVAVLPQAVPPEDLDRANARIAGTQTIVDEFIGPPLGGFLFGAAAFAPSLLTVGAFLAAGLAYWLLRRNYSPASGGASGAGTPDGSGPADQQAAGVGGQIREGAAWAMHHPMVRTLVVIGGLASVGYMIPFSYLVIYARDVLHLDATGYGLLLSGSALGGLLGSLAAGRLRRAIGYGWTITAALFTGMTALAVIAGTTNVWVVAVALAVYMGHAVVWNITATTIRQRVIPARMMGRVGSVGRLVGLTGLALGAALGGLLAASLGLRIPFGVAAAFFAAGGLLALSALRHFRAWEAAAHRAGNDAGADSTPGRSPDGAPDTAGGEPGGGSALPRS